MAATYVSTLLIDRAGRKILLITSGFVMAFCLTSLGIYFIFGQNNPSLAMVPLACVAIYIIMFSIGFGPIPWMMVGELFTAQLKGPASSVSAAFNWTLAFTVTKLFQTMIDLLGSGQTFLFFAAISALGALFVVMMVPETKGKEIQEIQKMLVGEALTDTDKKFTVSSDVISISIKK